MKTVVVKFTVEQRVVANADKADHFVIGLGVIEASAPLTAREHTFTNVAPGSYAGFVSCNAADGSELAGPAVFSVEVPEDTPLTAPIPVTVTVTVS